MLVLPKEAQQKQDQAVREGLVTHYNAELERILNENADKEIYWILGKVRFPEENHGKVGRTFLEATEHKPPLIKDAFLYEVDNKRGVKTLLWVMHPDGSLRLPTLNKTLSVKPKGKKNKIIRA